MNLFLIIQSSLSLIKSLSKVTFSSVEILLIHRSIIFFQKYKQKVVEKKNETKNKNEKSTLFVKVYLNLEITLTMPPGYCGYCIYTNTILKTQICHASKDNMKLLSIKKRKTY